MSIIISGACGFLGSHLMERLLADGKTVYAVDDLRSSPLSIDDLIAEIGSAWSNVVFRQESIEYFALRGQNGVKAETIFHLAAPVGPAGILQHRGQIVRQIVDSTYAAIELSLIHRCRLVYVSTSEIYNVGGLCTEDMDCVVPVSRPSARLEYAIAKMAGEIAVLNTPELDAVVVRPFNLTGPRQSPVGGFVTPIFVQAALSNAPLPVFNNGNQQRAFTHVNDAVQGLLLAGTKGEQGQAYNIGNPANRIHILELAEKVIELTGSSSKITFTDGKKVYGSDYVEASDKYPSADKAIKLLGWQPRYDLDATILDVIAYERSKLS